MSQREKLASVALRWSALALVSGIMSAALPASAETLVFKDVLKPHGVSRSQADKLAAAAACKAAGVSIDNVPAIEKCLGQKGWALASIRPDATDAPGPTYDDMWQPANGPRRSNAALENDSHTCNPSGKSDVKGADVQRCMTAHGWRLSFVIPEPSSHSSPNRTEDAGVAPGSYFDPTTGLVCHQSGGFDVCQTPTGKFDYYNPKDGTNCHRDGLVLTCSNF